MIDSRYKGQFGKEVETLPETTLTAISNLKSETVNFEGKSIEVLGYYAKGDGGGGLFYWDSASTEADNGGTIIQATSIVNGRWKRVFSGAVNAKWFGAKGDGVTDDTEAIEACFQNASLYGKILIPDGLFTATSRLTPLEGQQILFIGKIILNTPDTIETTLMRIRHPNITLYNPRLDMNRGVSMENSISGTQSTLSIYGNGYNLTLNGGVIENGIHNNLQGGRHNLIVNGTRFENAGEHSIYIHAEEVGGEITKGITLNNIKINNVALDNLNITEGHLIQMRNCEDVKINGGFFDTGHDGSTVPSFFILATNCNNVIINGSTIRGVSQYLVYWESDCKEITFNNINAYGVDNAIRTTHISKNLGQGMEFYKSKFHGFSSSEKQPDKSVDCFFYDIPYRFEIKRDSVFERCHFHLPTGNWSMKALNNSSLSLRKCILYGNSSIGLSSEGIDNKLTVIDCEFPDHDHTKALSITGGVDHVITGNSFPSAVSSQVILLSSCDGTSIIKNNYLPLGKIGVISSDSIKDSNITSDGVDVRYIDNKDKVTNYSTIDNIKLPTTKATADEFLSKTKDDVKVGKITFSNNINGIQSPFISASYRKWSNIGGRSGYLYISQFVEGNNGVWKSTHSSVAGSAIISTVDGFTLVKFSKPTAIGQEVTEVSSSLIESVEGSQYKANIAEANAKNFPPIQNTDNLYTTEAAMYADQANQLEGYGYLVDGAGAFAYLGTVAGTAADYKPFIPTKDIKLQGAYEDDSTIYFYEGTAYFFIRNNSLANFFEFGSNDGSGEVISARIDRGKTDWEFQDRIQILKPGRGVSFLTPSATNLGGNSSANKYELRVNEGGVIELWTLSSVGILDVLVWSSADVTAKKVDTTFDLSNLGSYSDDAAANTGGVSIGFAYINSSTGAMHRRLT